jgi:hypothetical protein
MYLEIRKDEFVSKYRPVHGELKLEYPTEFEEFFSGYDNKAISRKTSFEVGYWRKANQIHNWIIENCADGLDECQQIEVGVDDLANLRDLCKTVLEDHSKASELLPTRSGFFFGSLEYDEYYFKDLEDTIEIIEPVLAFMEKTKDENGYYNYDIIYQASW